MEDVSRIRKVIKIQIVTYKVEYGTFPHLSKNKKIRRMADFLFIAFIRTFSSR